MIILDQGAPALAADPPGMSMRICLFWHRLLDLIFPPICLDLGSSLGSIWHQFSIILASLFRAWLLHKCFIDFGMDVDVMFDGFLMTFLVRACNLRNH